MCYTNALGIELIVETIWVQWIQRHVQETMVVVTWCLILLEAAIRKWIHGGHKGMGMCNMVLAVLIHLHVCCGKLPLVWQWFCVSHLLWANGCDEVGFIEGRCVWLCWHCSLLIAHTTHTAVIFSLSVQECNMTRSKIIFIMDSLLLCELYNEDAVIFRLSVQARACRSLKAELGWWGGGSWRTTADPCWSG